MKNETKYNNILPFASYDGNSTVSKGFIEFPKKPNLHLKCYKKIKHISQSSLPIQDNKIQSMIENKYEVDKNELYNMNITKRQRETLNNKFFVNNNENGNLYSGSTRVTFNEADIESNTKKFLISNFGGLNPKATLYLKNYGTIINNKSESENLQYQRSLSKNIINQNKQMVPAIRKVKSIDNNLLLSNENMILSKNSVNILEKIYKTKMNNLNLKTQFQGFKKR